MTEPLTEAGRTLLAAPHAAVGLSDDPVYVIDADSMPRIIRAIEAEAAAAQRERTAALVEAEVKDRTALLDKRLADLRRAALAVYHGRIGYENPDSLDILALGVVLFPERAALEAHET